jgi:uncharacterized repeat protein (TIGR03803 family)
MKRRLISVRIPVLIALMLFLAQFVHAGEFVIHRFGHTGDGSVPSSGLVADAAGNLYGETVAGGTANAGTIYQLAPPVSAGGAWTETVLYSFTGKDGDGVRPLGALAIDESGNLYGSTDQGGDANLGAVFELSPPSQAGEPWVETILYSFTGGNDAATPQGGVTVDATGNLFGTAEGGGTANQGTVFELSPPISNGAPWVETVLYSFQASADGALPFGSLAFDRSGNLFGATTLGGGALCGGHGCGTVFELSPPSQPGGVWTGGDSFLSRRRRQVSAVRLGDQQRWRSGGNDSERWSAFAGSCIWHGATGTARRSVEVRRAPQL